MLNSSYHHAYWNNLRECICLANKENGPSELSLYAEWAWKVFQFSTWAIVDKGDLLVRWHLYAIPHFQVSCHNFASLIVISFFLSLEILETGVTYFDILFPEQTNSEKGRMENEKTKVHLILSYINFWACVFSQIYFFFFFCLWAKWE